MNQTCKVCGEVAAGYHFGAFTCEGCKSFFGRTYNNRSSIGECKNNNSCVINKKNRTSCKSCRLKKCFNVGMSKSGSRYGRRSNWFKIHCLLQDQHQQQQQHQQQEHQHHHQTTTNANGTDLTTPADLSAGAAELARDLTTSSNNSAATTFTSNSLASSLGNHNTTSNGLINLPHVNLAANANLAAAAAAAAAAGSLLAPSDVGPFPANHSSQANNNNNNNNNNYLTGNANSVANAANYINSQTNAALNAADNSNSQLYQSALAQILFYYMISQQQQPQQI